MCRGDLAKKLRSDTVCQDLGLTKRFELGHLVRQFLLQTTAMDCCALLIED